MIDAPQRDDSLIAPTHQAWTPAAAGEQADHEHVAVSTREAAEAAAEIFRAIYTRAGAGVSETLAVCSSIAGEGKSTVALGLAVTIAQDFPELRVLLVETDLQHPIFARDFNVEAVPGLAECLAEGEAALFAHRPTRLPNLQVIPAGAGASGSTRLLRSSHMALMLDSLRGQNDIVILDVPAVMTSSDALLLTDLADGVIFVIRAGVTPHPVVQKALAQIDRSKLRGLVLNGAQSHVPVRVRQVLGL